MVTREDLLDVAMAVANVGPGQGAIVNNAEGTRWFVYGIPANFTEDDIRNWAMKVFSGAQPVDHKVEMESLRSMPVEEC